MKNIKIVLTGGPCGGKTTSIHEFQRKLQDKYNVLITEEIANGLLKLGYLDEIKLSIFDFQNLLFKIQFINEYNAENNSEILLCDRGLLDSKAYLNNSEFNKILFENNVELEKIFKTYNFALYFRTIAYEYPNLFRQMRIYETPASAIERDKLLFETWKSILLDIRYSNYDGFNNKMNLIFNELNDKLLHESSISTLRLSDLYDNKKIDDMLNGIDEILYKNRVPLTIKKKTLRLIK